ncbi:MAG TPA: Na+/H+ antiporter [Bryobacteraceae bacterium]|nr:Na+/H+ antiporter [Bryobacteraceae bacterium]
MTADSIHEVETLVLLLLTVVIIFALIARKLDTPYPIVLVIAGLVLGFVPGVPQITLNPDLIFLLVLPPLLFSAAWNTSWREFRFNLISIAMLAFGLVGFTVLGVSLLAPLVFPGFTWELGFVLGALVSTTDAIAAMSIAKRVGLPRRIMDLLEGESLLNDATGLLALEFGTSLVVYKQVPTVLSGFQRLTWLTLGGLAIGLMIGFVVDRVERRLEYGSIEIMLSLLVPYGAYLAAEAAHASGVLAVVACGLYLSRKSAEFFSPKTRLQTSAVWESLSFALNGITFILIGLQLPSIWSAIGHAGWRKLLLDGLLFSTLLVLIRMIWVYPGAYVASFFRRHLLKQHTEAPAPRQLFVVGWTGMRGVIALAAALSLPSTVADGSPFPQRTFLVYLCFSVILFSLVFQGLTLPKLIRLLGLEGHSDSKQEEKQVRRLMLQAALSHLQEKRNHERPEWTNVYDHLADHYRARLDQLADATHDDQSNPMGNSERFQQLAWELLGVERRTALSLRREGKLSDESWRKLEREIDLAELRGAQAGHMLH